MLNKAKNLCLVARGLSSSHCPSTVGGKTQRRVAFCTHCTPFSALGRSPPTTPLDEKG